MEVVFVLGIIGKLWSESKGGIEGLKNDFEIFKRVFRAFERSETEKFFNIRNQRSKIRRIGSTLKFPHSPVFLEKSGFVAGSKIGDLKFIFEVGFWVFWG